MVRTRQTILGGKYDSPGRCQRLDLPIKVPSVLRYYLTDASAYINLLISRPSIILFTAYYISGHVPMVLVYSGGIIVFYSKYDENRPLRSQIPHQI